MQRTFKIAAVICIALILLGLFVFRTSVFTCWDFRNNLWGPAYLLTQGKSPYRVDQLFDLGNAVWMPTAVGLFFPLGFFTLQQASNLWFVFNLVWVMLLIPVSSGSRRPPPLLLAIAVLLSFLFPPTVTHLWSGQISILITLTFVTIAIWNDKMPIMLIAFLMAVGLSKPQLDILVVPGFLIYKLRNDGAQKTIQLIVYWLGCILLLTIPLFLAYPNWIPDFIWELHQNPSWSHPSTLNFLQQEMSNFGTVIWIVLVIILAAINIWMWVTRPILDAVNWSLALTLLITPYIWTWDFVMMLPLFISSLFKAKTKLSLGILLAGYAICWGLITNMKSHNQVEDSLFWWVPWLLLAFIIGNKYVQGPIDSLLKQAGFLNKGQNTS